MKEIIYKIWYYFHNAITHKIIADKLYYNYNGRIQFSKGLTDVGVSGECEICNKNIKEIYYEFYSKNK